MRAITRDCCACAAPRGGGHPAASSALAVAPALLANLAKLIRATEGKPPFVGQEIRGVAAGRMEGWGLLNGGVQAESRGRSVVAGAGLCSAGAGLSPEVADKAAVYKVV